MTSEPTGRPAAKITQHVGRWVIIYRFTAAYVIVALAVIIGILLSGRL